MPGAKRSAAGSSGTPKRRKRPKPAAKDEWEDDTASSYDEYESYDDGGYDSDGTDGDAYEDYQPARPRRSSPSRSAKTKPKKKNRKASRSDDGGRFSFTSPLVWLGFPFAATLVTIAAVFIVPIVGSILAIIVLIVGLILTVIGGIRILIGAFQEDVVCGLLYLFVPFYSLYYLVTRWEEQKSAFLMNVCGGLLVCGAGIALPAAQHTRNKAREAAGAAAITVPLSEVTIALYINETVPDVAKFLRVNHSARGNFLPLPAEICTFPGCTAVITHTLTLRHVHQRGRFFSSHS